ncbi:hypothetical protein Y694_04670 [Methylibium sp. T29-B]|nr:hypothetical protein Y694_04670 [Methylibium sp. T29-B]
MGRTQGGVELVGDVALAEAVQRGRLRRFMRSDAQARIAGFVEVVADEQHQVQVARGDLAVQRELALLVVLAGRQRDAQAADPGLGRRRGAGAPERAGRLAGMEAVEVAPIARQTRHLGVHAVRVLGPGPDHAGAPFDREALVLGQFPAHRDGRVGQATERFARTRGQPGPQHHASGAGMPLATPSVKGSSPPRSVSARSPLRPTPGANSVPSASAAAWRPRRWRKSRRHMRRPIVPSVREDPVAPRCVSSRLP